MGLPKRVTQSWQMAAVDLGCYFTAGNATPGTGVATIATQASFVATSPFISLVSPPTPASFIGGPGPEMWLDFLWLKCTAPGTAGTGLEFAMSLDLNKANPTGGVGGVVASPTFTVSNGAANNNTPGAQIFAGPLVAPAASGSARGPVAARTLRTVIPVAGDEYLIKFGEVVTPASEGLSPSGATILVGAWGVPPFKIGYGALACQFHIWLPGQTAASSWEYQIGWAEFLNIP